MKKLLTLLFGNTLLKAFGGGLFLFLFTSWANLLIAQEVYTISNGIWSDPTIWSTGIIPNNDNNIAIYHQVTHNGKLWVDAGGVLNIMPGGNLIQNGELKVNGHFVNKGIMLQNGDVFVYGQFENESTITVNGNPDCDNGDSGGDNYCKGFFNMPTGSVLNSGSMILSGDLINDGTWTMLGDAHMNGNLYNNAMMLGPNGIFYVCGNAYHEENGTVTRVPVYLCLECNGVYTDKGVGSFELNCSPFPVEITAFQGQSVDGNVQLTWKTASEQNLDKFVIERADSRSNDACIFGTCDSDMKFTVIGEVDAAGTSTMERSYSYLDKNAATGVNFYRLKSVDNDGTSHYSNVIEVYHQIGETEMLVWPNPTYDAMNIRLTRRNYHQGTLSLYDLSGRLIWTKKMDMAENEVRLSIPVCDYAAGTYILNYAFGNEKITRKVVFTK